MKKNSTIKGLMAEVLDELKNDEINQTSTNEKDEMLETNNDPVDDSEVNEIVNEEVKKELSDESPKNYNFLGIDIAINTDEEGHQVLTLTKDEYTVTKEVESLDFQNLIGVLQEYILELHDQFSDEENVDEENLAEDDFTEDDMPEGYDNLTDEEKKSAMESYRLIANIYKTDKNKLIELAKLGYSLKKFVLSNLREDLFSDNIKGYIEKNKSINDQIVLANTKLTETKKNYIVAKKLNQDLRKKYSLVANILSETKKAFLSEKGIDKSNIKKILACVIKGMDLDNDKFCLLAQKSQSAIKSIIANTKTDDKKNVVNSKINKEEVVSTPSKAVVSNVSRKPNLITNGGYGKSTSTLKESNDGTDEMMIELKRLISAK